MQSFEKLNRRWWKMGKLTIKQQKFADEYIISGNATDAAIKAGYSKKTATVIGAENLIKPNIKQYIDERMAQLQSSKIASQEEILEYLTRVVRGEETEQVLKGEGKGEQSIDVMEVTAKDRIKAAELLGKRYSTWTEKVDINANVHNDGFEDVLEMLKNRG